MKFRLSTIVVALLLAILCAPALIAQDGLSGAFSRGVAGASAMPGRSAQVVAADFDEDQKPDGAVLLEDGFANGKRTFRIELHVTAGSNNAIRFSSAEARLEVSALDVNRDGAPDIVVEKSFTHERLQVYLNDGHGSFYTARAEDYPAQYPSAPNWRTELSQSQPTICLPATRNPDTEALRQVSTLRRELSAPPRPQFDGLLVQSAARAPSASRAPPSLLSL